MREVLIVVGETSGDLHAAGLATALHSLRPELSLTGVGGARMDAAGVELLERTDRMAVMGFVEVLRQVPHHWELLRRLRARLRGGRVALLVVIDYPGFNMKLAAAAREAGVPVLYYITPQVWAWGAGRLAKLARLVTRAACILPFEASLLREHGVDATFVGHPLLDRAADLPSREAARSLLGLDASRPVLALFPGSRAQEIVRHLDDFVTVGRTMQARLHGLQVVVSVAPGVELDAARCPYPAVASSSFAVLRAADAALCKSGTTTLEAAVAGCPLAVVYRTSKWTYAIARRVVKIPHIGLVNVVAGREVAREFVQDAFEPGAVVNYLLPLMDRDSDARRSMLRDLAAVRDALGTPGAAGRVARIASDLVP
ncbi:MAG TPA: lipid-A-disaccharide synthase [Gemmatimonadaceae bacterium]|nr:lipid-A-disaccharide synthase [Gemmatimonadaceae bacterium]